MEPQILLTGSSGQIGRALAAILPGFGEVTALNRRQLDINKPENIREVIRTLRPEIILNAAAYTNVESAESEEAAALLTNAEGPRVMAEEAQRIGAALVHYSTDYVFDGSKRTPYVEADSTSPLSAYGRTKLAGERAIICSGVPHLIFRTAWVYDQEGRNFLRTILRLATQKKELRIVQDQIGAPTWSRAIALATLEVLRFLCRRNNIREAFAELGGVYHMTAGGETSWYGFARAILEEASSHSKTSSWIETATGGHPLIAHRITPIDNDEYPTRARRPAYSVLSNARLGHTFGVHLTDWRMQLHEVFSEDGKEAR